MQSNPITFNNRLGKIFIGGLGNDTTSDSLRKYFEKFGEICDCVIMSDKNSNRSRGFGFITLMDCSKVDEVLKNQPHCIDGKQVECKIAIPKDYISQIGTETTLTSEQQSSGLYNNRKIFVGGLHPALKENEMTIYFEQFGEIEQCVIMHDKPTGKSRGFGFLVYKEERAADKVMLYKDKHCIMGKWVDCKRAMPKDILQKDNLNNNNNKNVNFIYETGNSFGNNNTYMNNNNNNNNQNFNYNNFSNQHQNYSYNPNYSNFIPNNNNEMGSIGNRDRINGMVPTQTSNQYIASSNRTSNQYIASSNQPINQNYVVNNYYINHPVNYPNGTNSTTSNKSNLGNVSNINPCFLPYDSEIDYQHFTPDTPNSLHARPTDVKYVSNQNAPSIINYNINVPNNNQSKNSSKEYINKPQYTQYDQNSHKFNLNNINNSPSSGYLHYPNSPNILYFVEDNNNNNNNNNNKNNELNGESVKEENEKPNEGNIQNFGDTNIKFNLNLDKSVEDYNNKQNTSNHDNTNSNLFKYFQYKLFDYNGEELSRVNSFVNKNVEKVNLFIENDAEKKKYEGVTQIDEKCEIVIPDVVDVKKNKLSGGEERFGLQKAKLPAVKERIFKPY